MPIYEYSCLVCENCFEIDRRINDETEVYCPRCRKEKVKRLISKSTFALKGGGWYADLYSKKF